MKSQLSLLQMWGRGFRPAAGLPPGVLESRKPPRGHSAIAELPGRPTGAAIAACPGFGAFACALVAFLLPTFAPAAPPQSAYVNLPLSFERDGEGPRERFIAQGKGYAIGLEHGRAVIGIAPGKLISLEFAGAKEVQAAPEDELPGKVNRYTGSDPRRWKTAQPTFGKVAYKDVYPGIDIVYYGNQKQLEFDFVVSPGTDPRAIRMKIGGASPLAIDSSGALVIDKARDLRIALPSVYQERGGVRTKIAGRYEIRGPGLLGNDRRRHKFLSR
jgi:hypothetical protein